jgi:zinc transport system ATP-binding protein
MIEVSNLSFSYQGTPVLENIGFSVGAGEFVALIGANGTGKSTLLRLLLGELQPQGGEIRLFGEDIRRFREWHKIGYVPQDSVSLAEGFPASVLEAVTLSLYRETGRFRLPGRREREKALAALAQVGMGEHSRRLIGTLSGGQIQRVMIARVLAAGSGLLLLDEPTSGMDPESTERFYGLLKGLAGDGMTVLLVTHDLARAGHYVNRTLCLDEDSAMHLYHPALDVRCIHHRRHGGNA